MDDVSIVEHLIAIAKLLKEEPYFLFGEIVLVIEDVLLEVALIAILHDYVEIPLAGYLDLHAVDKIGMVRKLPQHLQFGLDGSAGFFVMDGNDFDCQFLAGVLQVISSLDSCE